jgi:hypothetical protein
MLEQMYGLLTGCAARYVTVDVRPRAWTYSLECDMELYFHQPSYSSCFLNLELF